MKTTGAGPDIERIDAMLAPWRATIGRDFTGYRHHVVRVSVLCMALHAPDADEARQIEIAACFHDLGLWSADTFDYLEPSIEHARAFLVAQELEAWYPAIARMIAQHHKLRSAAEADQPLVEPFRRADLVDVSWGTIRFGLGRRWVKTLRQRYPDAGFHAMLLRRAGRWFVRHPLNPAPMMKW